MEATIAEEGIRAAIANGSGNSVIRLLVNAHREFGTNAGTQTVRESREKSKLKYTNLCDFTIKVSNYVKFYTEVDRHVMMAIEILGELEEAIGREGNNKQVQSAIQRILADHLPTFSNDPAGEAKALVPKLVSAIRAAASMVQTTSEFRSKPDAGKLKANLSSASGKSAACFEYFATGACKRGESCGFSHQQLAGVSSAAQGRSWATGIREIQSQSKWRKDRRSRFLGWPWKRKRSWEWKTRRFWRTWCFKWRTAQRIEGSNRRGGNHDRSTYLFERIQCSGW